MESFSRFLPISRCRFSGSLHDSLLAASPFVFEEDLHASYIVRQARDYKHNPARAAIAVTQDSRLVVMTSGVKKIDVLLSDPQHIDTLAITSDKDDRIIFKVQTGVLGTGTVGSSLEIRVWTKTVGQILQLAEMVRGHAKADSMELEAQISNTGQFQPVQPSAAYGTTLPSPPAQPVQRRLSRKPIPASRAAT